MCFGNDEGILQKNVSPLRTQQSFENVILCRKGIILHVPSVNRGEVL